VPTVSVITPAYNAAAFLATAVESVLRQSLTDLEMLIVDDGSSDGTVAAARQLAARDARVRVLTQPNAGPGPARNTAFRHARGRYFAFLDSDDEWDRTFLARQVAILDERSDLDVVIGNARNRGGDRDGEPSRPWRGAAVQPISLAEILADETSLFIMAVFRRDVVERVNGFDPALLTNEEYDLWIRAAIAGFAIARNPAPLGWYTCRPGSLSFDQDRMHVGILRVLARTRPLLAPRSTELAILDRQIAHFEAELAAIRARQALGERDYPAAARHLAELSARRGDLSIRAAAALMAYAPRAGAAAYHMLKQMKALVRSA
jgi:glycosyltransferase involved in cell wall biosynthesis